MVDSTIVDTYTLPSKGLIYGIDVNPRVKLRSMTTRDEMKRLGSSERPLELLCEVIEDCIVGDKPKIHVYDMYLGDFQFLLHRLRMVTYGSKYKMTVRCPVCGSIINGEIDLKSLEVKEYDDSFKDLLVVDLPASKKRVELNYMTPRIYDDIAIRTAELKSKMKNSNENRSLQITLTTLIKTVDGKVLSPAEIEAFVNNLPMRDTNILLKRLEKINGKVGINTITTIKCSQCGHDIVTSFRSTPEFFGPEEDE